MRKLSSADRAGLYITVSIHLAVILVLLLTVVTPALKREYSFEIDLSQIEEMERLQEELEFKKKVNDRLNELLRQNGLDPVQTKQEAPKTFAVDRSYRELLKENDRIQKDIRETLDGREAAGEGSISVSTEKPKKQEDQSAGHEYTGPSVVSYDLGGRKASRLPIPSYKCLGGGEVTVLIDVNPQGKVIGAQILDEVSSSDECLRRFAITAAYRAMFSIDSKAPAKQRGDIVYSFIAQ